MRKSLVLPIISLAVACGTLPDVTINSPLTVSSPSSPPSSLPSQQPQPEPSPIPANTYCAWDDFPSQFICQYQGSRSPVYEKWIFNRGNLSLYYHDYFGSYTKSYSYEYIEKGCQLFVITNSGGGKKEGFLMFDPVVIGVKFKKATYDGSNIVGDIVSMDCHL